MLKKTLFSAVSVLFVANSNLVAQHEQVNQKPNFIVIFTDDLGYGDVGSAGSDLILRK